MNKDDIDFLLSKPNIAAELLKRDFKSFVRVFHYHLTSKEFIFKQFHKEIIQHLESIALGTAEKKDLIINMVPRFGKSIIMQYFVAWSFALNPKSNFIYTSYSDNLVLSFSDNIRGVLTSELFQKLFNIKFSKSEDSKRKWTTEDGGGIYAAAQGGSVTGFGAGGLEEDYAGALIVDDPIKPMEARSELMRQKSIDYFEETLSNRLNNPKKTPIIIIMQRLHIDDLCGYLEKTYHGRFTILTYPAYNEDTQESIWPEKYDSNFFEKLKITNPYYYYSQFQQEPITLGGNIIKGDWFKHYRELPHFKRVFITADTAQKIKQSNDYSVFGVWGVADNGLYLVDMLRGKWEAPELKQAALELWNRFKIIDGVPCAGFYIEDKTSGTGLIQELQRHGLPIIPLQRGKGEDKLTRLQGVLDYIFSGKVFLPELRPDIVKPFIAECEAFARDDSHKHDDQVDVMIDAITMALTGFTTIKFDEKDNREAFFNKNSLSW